MDGWAITNFFGFFFNIFWFKKKKSTIFQHFQLFKDLFYYSIFFPYYFYASPGISFKSSFYFTGGLFDKWMDGQLPIPEWTPLILPDEILCEELSPTSPTPTEDGGGVVAGPGNFF